MSASADSDFFHWQGETLVLRLKVQPRASRNAWGEVIGERVKLYLTTPPVDGKANQAVVAFVAKTFSVAKNRVESGVGKPVGTRTSPCSGPLSRKPVPPRQKAC